MWVNKKVDENRLKEDGNGYIGNKREKERKEKER